MSWLDHYREEAKDARRAAHALASEGRESEAQQFLDIADVYDHLADSIAIEAQLGLRDVW